MPPSNRTEPDRQADRALVERCLGHEPGAFDELYRRFAPRVFTLACRMSGSRSSGEDLLQEIFLLVYRKLGSFKGEAALGTWVYRLATNCCLDFLRSRQHRLELVSDELDESLPPRARARSRPSGSISSAPSHSCRRVSGGLCAPRRGRLRPRGSRTAAGDCRGHLEVAGAQGADEDAGVAAIQKLHDCRLPIEITDESLREL